MRDERLVKRGRHIVVVLLGLVLFACVVYAAEIPAVQKLLPIKGEVAGYGLVPDTLVYGKGADISSIYDGGYELYTKNGVLDAARQMYQHDKSYLEVTIHTMTSNKAALVFLKYWAKDRKGKLQKSKFYSGFTVPKPNYMAYYAIEKYLVTVTTYGSEDKAKKNVEDFISAIAKKTSPRH